MKNHLGIYFAVFFFCMLLSVRTLAAPAAPISLSSDSHDTESCNSDRTVNIVWEVPDPGTVGIKGYSVLWDDQPDTLPGETVTTEKNSTTSHYLDIGNYYVHIRSVDNENNWSDAALHGGPFCISEYEIPGDINNDDAVNLSDAMLGLKLTAAVETGTVTIRTDADVNNDGVMGLAEVIYILKRIAGLIFSPGDCLRFEEAELARLVNEYREDNGLDPLTVSGSLTRTAQWHVLDLHENEPDTGDCSQHSWSDKGTWTPVCDTNILETWALTQAKPIEITYNVYTGYGYEVAYGNVMEQATAELAIKYLTESDAHKAVILQQSTWDQLDPWTVMGVGVYEHHAVVWFGTADDPLGTVGQCE